MKTSILKKGLPLLIFSFILSGSAQSQDNADLASAVASDLFNAKHIVKTNLVGYVFYSITANYEAKTGEATSVGLLGGYKLPQTITVDGIAKNLNEEEDSQSYTGEIEPRGWFINPYFRFYAQESMEGFYFEGFLRIYNFEYDVPYDYEKDDRTIRAYADGTAKAWGGGLGFGSQFSLAKHWFLDLNLGFGLAKGDIHIETSDPNLDADDYADIKDKIERNRNADVEIFLLSDVLTELEADANSQKAWADINDVVLPIVRAGVSIGFAF